MDKNIELKKLELEADLKRFEISASVRKVIFGTFLVGVAAAAFPFASGLAQEFFGLRMAEQKNELEERIKQLEFDLAAKRQQLEERSASRVYLESLAAEARSENLQRRIVLADFYSYLAADEAERLRWSEFRKFLLGKQQDLGAEIAAAQVVQSDPDANLEDKTKAADTIRQAEEYRRPNLTFSWSEPWVSELQFNLRRNGFCDRMTEDGSLGPQTVEAIGHMLGEKPLLIVEMLRYQRGRELISEWARVGNAPLDWRSNFEANRGKRLPESASRHPAFTDSFGRGIELSSC